MGYLFHCPTCNYDLCKKCDISRNEKILKQLPEPFQRFYLLNGATTRYTKLFKANLLK
jgi:hypothetical protein